MNTQTLTSIILNRMSIEELYKLYSQKAIIDIEREIERRLYLSDLPTINFLFNNRYSIDSWLKSVYIRQGISNALFNIPWKIGVIYNYTDESYQVNNISVILGDENYKTKKGKRFISTWLESNKSRLVLREVTSLNHNVINPNTTLRITDPNLDNAIRQALMNNDMITLTVCMFIAPPGTSFRTYDETLPAGEAKAMYPCHISAEGFDHALINLPPGPINALDYVVNITKSEKYSKLRDLYFLTLK